MSEHERELGSLGAKIENLSEQSKNTNNKLDKLVELHVEQKKHNEAIGRAFNEIAELRKEERATTAGLAQRIVAIENDMAGVQARQETVVHWLRKIGGALVATVLTVLAAGVAVVRE